MNPRTSLIDNKLLSLTYRFDRNNKLYAANVCIKPLKICAFFDYIDFKSLTGFQLIAALNTDLQFRYNVKPTFNLTTPGFKCVISRVLFGVGIKER